jgi:hypothetical protein
LAKHEGTELPEKPAHEPVAPIGLSTDAIQRARVRRRDLLDRLLVERSILRAITGLLERPSEQTAMGIPVHALPARSA